MSFEKEGKSSGTRRKARECALQMLFAADVLKNTGLFSIDDYWNELGDAEFDEKTRLFANNLVQGARDNNVLIDDRIRTRAEHWRIERMAIVDRNVLRLAVYEFLYQDTPHTVVINEALEIARRFSTFEATQFINGILDAIKLDLEKETSAEPQKADGKSTGS
jgi:N utilization substance protein B